MPSPTGRAFGGGGPHRGVMAAGGRAKNFKGSLLRLMGFLRPYAGWLTLILLLNILASGMTALAPRVLALATNEIARGSASLLSGAGAGIDFSLLGRILAVLFAVYAISALAGYAVNFVLSSVTQRSMYDLRRTVDQKLDHLPLVYLDSHPFGDTLSRVTNDVDTIATSMQQSLSQALSSILSVVMIFIMMCTINPLLTVVALATMPLGALVSARIIKFSQKFFKGQQRSLGNLNGYIEEMYNGHTVIKAFGREEAAAKEFEALNDELYRFGWKAQFCSGVMMPIISFLTNLGYVLVTVLGGWLVLAGQLLVGDIQAMIQYMRQFSHPVAMFANIANVLQSAVAAAERIFELLDEPEELPDPEHPVQLKHVRGDLRLTDVRFSYDADPVIKGISADIKSGQKIAIVGPTGSGKTTLVNLLLRFYELDAGDIAIDGVSIKGMAPAALRAHFGMVLQDTWLFKGSILENIRYGRLGASDEEVRAAAKAAYADRFIRQLPGGYAFELGEDATNISQGQRQLLTIARAVLADPDVLILDEATSSVDTRTELLIQRAMLNLMKGRTSLVIAHRLSTIRDADVILVLKDGEIIERGSHDELLAAGGFYETLYNSQFAAEE